MLKFGISNIYQLKSKKFTNFLNKDKIISITLYEEIQRLPEADDFAERILLLFSDERGAYKRTYQKRFEEFDTQIINSLKEIFQAPSNLLSFHDVGISDGRTALDFFEKMVLNFPNIHYFASDYNSSLFILEKGKIKVTLSPRGKILEILFPPFVFNKIKRDSFRHYPLNHLLCFLIEKIFVNPLVHQYRQGLVQAHELLLFAPKVLQKAREEERFKLGQQDLLQPFKKTFDIIRAMNVLNPSYFSEAEFEKVIRNLYEGLQEKGILITGSNQEAGTLVHGSLYQKCEKGFKKLLGSGGGSPIETLILTFKA